MSLARGILLYNIASLAQTIQFPMEMSVNQFLILLKGHSMINSTNEDEPDVLNTLRNTGLKTQSILNNL